MPTPFGRRPGRRDFLRTVAVLAASAAGTSNSSSSPAHDTAARPIRYSGEIIDTHQHLWNLQVLTLEWVGKTTGRAREVLAKNHTPADYAEAARNTNIRRAVYMEVDVADASRVKEAEFVIGECKQHQPGVRHMTAAVIGARPLADDFAAYLDRFRGVPQVKGVRQVLRGQDVLLSPKFIASMQELGKRNLLFDLCLKPEQLPAAAELVDLCPDTRFILDHCGDPFKLDGFDTTGKTASDLSVWERGLAAIARARNPVICKISGLYGDVSAQDWPAAKLRPIVRRVIAEFGWDRVIFASDWPVVNLGASLHQWLDAVSEIVAGDPPEQQKRLFHDNAVRVYGL